MTEKKLAETEKYLLVGRFLHNSQHYLSSPIKLLEQAVFSLSNQLSSLQFELEDQDLSGLRRRELDFLFSDMNLALSRLSKVHQVILSQMILDEKPQKVEFASVIKDICMILEKSYFKSISS